MATSKAKDLADFISKQSSSADSILETGAMQLPAGTTGERPTAVAGMIRYNSTSTLSEYYDGSNWKSIDSPPTIASISPTTETDASADIVITGSNFGSNVTVKFVGNDGTEYTSPSVTRNSSTQVTATTPSTALSVSNEPYDVVVTNTNSSLAGTLSDALDAGGVPAFTKAAGTHTIYDTGRSGTFDAGATDPDGDTITYSVSAGSLPAGASISSSTGAITGFSAVGSNTSSTFTVSAATSSDTSTRQFTIAVQAPIVTSYTSTGSGTYTVPSGLTAVDVLVVAGGGAGGNGQFSPGGGGGGGLIFRPAFPVTPGGSVSYTVGTGGQGQPQRGDNGQDSTFSTLTAKGGGGAGGYDPSNAGAAVGIGRPGGSGGGGGSSPGGPTGSSNVSPTGQGYNYVGGDATQPQQSGDSGTYGFGFTGGTGGHDTGDWEGGGGGGGAGGTGSPGNSTITTTSSPPRTLYTADSAGGHGKNYSISGSTVGYAGGGGGGGNTAGPAQHGGGNGTSTSPAPGTAGTANRGGGGGGSFYRSSGVGASGGSGIVIVKY
jgi:hypothetical protein